MNTVQERILKAIEEQLVKKGYQPAVSPDWGNTGNIFAYKGDDMVAEAEITYNFQTTTYTLTLTVNGSRIPSQPGRMDYFEFYQRYDEESKFWTALRVSLRGA